MKILVLCEVLFPQTVGGAGRVARALGEGMREQGAVVHYLTRKTDPASVEEPGVSFLPRLGPASVLDFRRRFQEVERRFQPDVVHIHQPLSAYLCIPRGYPRPIVYNFHSSWPLEVGIKRSRAPAWLRRGAVPLLKHMEGSLVRRAACVIVASRYMAGQVIDLYGRVPTLIPHGVDPDRFRPCGEKRRDGKKRLITVRNLVPRMGLPELIDALAALPESVHLEIAGEGPLRSSLNRRIRERGLESRVRLRGHVPEADLPRFYSEADWFVLPTRQLEGFGMVILESLACGTPVLGTRVGAIPELLEKFDARWVIPECSSGSIAETLRGALDLAVPVPEELHRRIAAEYDWRNILRRYRTLFEEALASSVSSRRQA